MSSDNEKMTAEEKFALAAILFWYVFFPVCIIVGSNFI
jgi:hypothetical protein